MSKLFRSIGIAATLGSIPFAAQALQVVDWGEDSGSTYVLWRPPQSFSAVPTWAIQEAPQHDRGVFRPVAARGLQALPAAGSVAVSSTTAPWVYGFVERGFPAGGSDFEGGGRSALLAGLGAVALLMWRRLRRG